MEMDSEKRYHRPMSVTLTIDFFTTLWSASRFSSAVIVSGTTLWSNSVLRLFFRCFLRLSLVVRPVSSSSWRSSSETLSSPRSSGRSAPVLVLPSSIILASSRPSVWLRRDSPLGREDLRLPEGPPAGFIKLLRLRRCPAGVRGSISISERNCALERSASALSVPSVPPGMVSERDDRRRRGSASDSKLACPGSNGATAGILVDWLSSRARGRLSVGKEEEEGGSRVPIIKLDAFRPSRWGPYHLGNKCLGWG